MIFSFSGDCQFLTASLRLLAAASAVLLELPEIHALSNTSFCVWTGLSNGVWLSRGNVSALLMDYRKMCMAIGESGCQWPDAVSAITSEPIYMHVYVILQFRVCSSLKRWNRWCNNSECNNRRRLIWEAYLIGILRSLIQFPKIYKI